MEAYWRRSEFERGWHEQRWQEARERCGQCGLPRSVCSNPELSFYPQRQVCYASMEREAANAKWQQLHADQQWHNGRGTSWAKDRSADHPFPRDAGLTIGIAETDLRPWDKFTTEKNAPFERASVDSDETTPAEADTSTGV